MWTTQSRFAKLPGTTILFLLLAISSGGAASVLLHLLGPFKTVAVLLGGIGVVGMVVYLEFGLLILVFLSYINFENVATEFHHAPSVVKFFVLIPCAAIALRWVLYKENPQGWQQAVTLFGLYGFAILASLLAGEQFSGQERALIIYVKYALTAVLMTILIQQKCALHRVIWTLLAAGAFLGMITSIQYLTQTFHNNYLGFGQVEILHIVGEVNDYRCGGPLGQPNAFARILLLPAALALDRFRNDPKLVLRILAGGTLILCLLAIIFTFSRGVLLGLLAMLTAAMLCQPPSLRVFILGLVVLIVVLPFVPTTYSERFWAMVDALPIWGGGLEESSVRGRASEMIASWQMYLDHPLLGVGWQNHKYYYQDYSRQLGLDPRRTGRVAHNIFQEIAAEMGSVGLAIFGIMLWTVFRGLWQSRHIFIHAGLRDDANLSLAVGIGLFGYLMASMFQGDAYPRYFWLPVGIALAIPNLARTELSVRSH